MLVFRPAFAVIGGRGRQWLGNVLGMASSATSLIKTISGDSSLSGSLDSLESDSGIKSFSES